MEMPSIEEMNLIMDRTTSSEAPTIEAVVGKERLVEIRRVATQVPVAPHVRDYAVRLIYATHPEHALAADAAKRYVRYGASPRGAQTIIRTAKVRALMDGRINVSTEDVRRSAAPALRHRVILNFEGQAEGVQADAIVAEVIERTPDASKG